MMDLGVDRPLAAAFAVPAGAGDDEIANFGAKSGGPGH